MAFYALMLLVAILHETQGQTPLQQPQQQQQQQPNNFLFNSNQNPGGDPLLQNPGGQPLHQNPGGQPLHQNTVHSPSGYHFCNCHGYQPGGNVLVLPPIPTISRVSPASPIPLGPAVTSPRGALGTTTTAPATTYSRCKVATNLCNLNCPDGYLVDPSDCTFCVCKKDVLGK